MHLDRLSSVIEQGCLLSDRGVRNQGIQGTVIGHSNIKERRLNKPIPQSNSLTVGDCVPLYFATRTPMLYIIHKNNSDLAYRDGQEPILYLVFSLRELIAGCNEKGLVWFFTSCNAAASHCEFFDSVNSLDQLDWDAIQAVNWMDCKEKKQAEFLVQNRVPWEQVTTIGVYSDKIVQQINPILEAVQHRPTVHVQKSWYY